MIELTKKERELLYDLVMSVPFQTNLLSLPKNENVQMLMALAAKLKSEDGDDTITGEGKDELHQD